MWGYYLYRFGLPLLVSLVILYFLSAFRWTKHKGWWFAGLFFGISLVCLLPMNGNPFDQVKLTHNKSQQVLKQAKSLTTSDFMGLSAPKLANKAVQVAWDCWHVTQVQKFFAENLGYNPDEPSLYPDKSKIRTDKLAEAEQLLDSLKTSDQKYQLESYLKDCQTVTQ